MPVRVCIISYIYIYIMSYIYIYLYTISCHIYIYIYIYHRCHTVGTGRGGVPARPYGHDKFMFDSALSLCVVMKIARGPEDGCSGAE